MNQQGFSLIEIMVVIAIISILSAIAVPGYQSYIQKAAITDMLHTILPYKNSIEICSFNRGNLALCDSGVDNIPTDITGKYISKIQVKSGVIKAVGHKTLSSLTVTFKPTLQDSNKPLKWDVTCEASNNVHLKSLCNKTFTF